MTDRVYILQADTARAAAADWVVRLRAPDAGETDWLDFESWLGAAPPNREAFDAAQRLWLELDARREELAGAVEVGRSAANRWPRFSRPAAFAALTVISVMVGGLALLAPLAGKLGGAPTTAAYTTAKGERRTVWLADGTRVDLNSDSTLNVRMGPGVREVSMEGAEAAFDVTHDANRPFVIHAGDRAVRVVGTQFDVARRDGRIAVTVRRGVVQVSPPSGTGAVSLTPGLQLRHREGAADSIVEGVQADDAFAWRQGRLIYRDAALGDVVDDLNHYFARPIRLGAGAAASFRFSGVLTVDDEARTLERLTALLPLKARDAKGGAIVLDARAPAP